MAASGIFVSVILSVASEFHDVYDKLLVCFGSKTFSHVVYTVYLPYLVPVHFKAAALH